VTRACVQRSPGGPLEVESVTPHGLSGDLVQVRILASGVCRSDLHATEGSWTTPVPFVPGHEGAGVVEAVGPEVEGVRPGDHVVLSWQAPCRRCRHCAAGRPWLCSGTRALEHVLPDGDRTFECDGEPVHGYLGLGTFSERTVVPESAAIPIDPRVPAAPAALIGCAVATGVGAVLRTAGVRPGESAVVLGCGGVGQSVLLGLRLAGAHPIIAVDTSPARLEQAAALGATHTIHGDDPDLASTVRALTDDTGADHAFEAIGGAKTIERLLDLVGRGGQAIVVGMPAEGTQIALDPLTLSDQSKRLVGCNYGSTIPQLDFPRLAALYLDGRLPIDRLVGRRAGLEDAGQALRDLRDVTGLRTVLLPEAV
jgi:S-(hydroxymethyl)glutathione dehydrogenase/alcohol dehydrogenase